MAVPKKKKSKMKTRSHRAGAWKLARPGAQRLPALRQRQAAAHGVPVLRLVQGPRRRRRRLTAGRRRSRAPPMLPIAVDAMGGDRAPGEIVAGATPAADAGIPVVLVGPRRPRAGIGDLPLIEASEVIAMDEDAAQGVRRKKDSTLVRAAEAVRDGKAVGDDLGRQHRRHDGVGAAAHGPHQGRQPPGDRHADPGARARRPTVLLDAGANAEVQPEWLVQFAQMGSVYARHRFGIAEPKVGLLSIGEEPGKGDTLRKEAYELLAARARASTSSATSRAATS